MFWAQHPISCAVQAYYFFIPFRLNIYSCVFFLIQAVKTSFPSLSSLCQGEKRMTYAHIANGIIAGKTFVCLLVQYRGAGIKRWPWVLSGDEIFSSQGAPRGPSHSSPVIFSPITKAISNESKSLCFRQAPATFHGMSHEAFPNQEWKYRLPWGTHSYSSINSNTKCSLNSVAHKPTPQFILGSRGNLGNTDFNRRA